MLSLDPGVQTLAGLHGQHHEAVFSANWFTWHALSNITLPLAVTCVNARLASDGTEELRIPKCVSIADRH